MFVVLVKEGDASETCERWPQDGRRVAWAVGGALVMEGARENECVASWTEARRASWRGAGRGQMPARESEQGGHGIGAWRRQDRDTTDSVHFIT